MLSFGCAGEPTSGESDAEASSDGTGWSSGEVTGSGAAPSAPSVAGTPSTAAGGGGVAEAAASGRFAPNGSVVDADLGSYHVSMTCEIDGEDIGTMTFDLWTEAAPITTRNFLRLCDEGFYDGISFHRIMRGFMAQGGDPTGTGAGNSPHGTIKAEFSGDPSRAHGYGVLSMARLGGSPDSASCQFFLCCAETPNVWNLDGQYSSFARMTSGVETLEKIADVPVRSKGRGEASSPTKVVKITRAQVHEGAAPTGEVIVRPEIDLDLGGEPQRVVVQHVLIAFKGAQGAAASVTRTKEEAEVLAAKILEQVQAGGDMTPLVLSASADPVQPGDPTPGYYALLNTGVRDPEGERIMFDINKLSRTSQAELRDMVRSGQMTQQEMEAKAKLKAAEFQKMIPDLLFSARARMIPAFGDLGFKLKVGEAGLVTHNARNSPFGFHIIKRMQ